MAAPLPASAPVAATPPKSADTGKIRVMVVDDSLVIRGLITRLLKESPIVDVIASVSDGQKAVERVRRGDIDVAILDIEMPVLDGISALPRMLEIDPKLVVIMASTLTTRNADVSLKALRAGAADYVPKPTTASDIYSAADFRAELTAKVIALGTKRLKARGVTITADSHRAPPPVKCALRPYYGDLPHILAIGSSTGGPRALDAFLRRISPTTNLPVVITQHMPPTFTGLLAEQLGRDTGWPVTEAVDGDAILPGRVLLAPGDLHMRAVRDGMTIRVKLDRREKENFCRPAVDPMLASLIPIYGAHIVTVILTGMGHDGLKGSQLVAANGGTILAQDEASSVVWGMPGRGRGRGPVQRHPTYRRTRPYCDDNGQGETAMSAPDITYLAEFLKSTSGLIISVDKGYLVESRLAPVATKHGCGNVADLVGRLKTFPPEALKRDVLEAMTTNETSFFRDNTPFEGLKTRTLPPLLKARASSRRLRILCAASSTGQEPYSIAMMLRELGPIVQGWNLEIVATDIDTNVIARAGKGVYTKFEVQRGLPITMLVKYFDQLGPDAWQIKSTVRDLVDFRFANILHEQPAWGTFDVIFCRNVLIYFDPATKAAVLARLAKHLADDGTLFLGGAETVIGISDKFNLSPGTRGMYSKTPKRLPALAA